MKKILLSSFFAVLGGGVLLWGVGIPEPVEETNTSSAIIVPRPVKNDAAKIIPATPVTKKQESWPAFFFAPPPIHNTENSDQESLLSEDRQSSNTKQGEDSSTIIDSYLRQYASNYRLNPDTLSGARLRYIHDTGRGAIIGKYIQVIGDLAVFRKELNVMTGRDGSLIAISGQLSPHVASMEKAGSDLFAQQVERLKNNFSLNPEAAIALAFKWMGGSKEAGLWVHLYDQDGYGFYAGPKLAGEYRPRQPARIKKIWFDAKDGLKPAYYIELIAGDFDTQHDDAYSHVISAEDGQILFRHSLVSSISRFSYRVYADQTPEHWPLDGPLGNGGTPHPLASETTPVWIPDSVSQNLITLSNGPIENSDPWLADSAISTRGNNADAYADWYAPDGYQASMGEKRATVNRSQVFDYLYDPLLAPKETNTQTQATIVQLFYTVNFLHDLYYEAGFDEASGNAQQNNYGRGGKGGDLLLAEAQDYGSRDNASIIIPADGSSPRMEMYLWSGVADKRVTVRQPAHLGVLTTGRALFGPRSFQLQGDLVLMNDGTEPIADGCSTVSQSAPLRGNIVLIKRGGCDFVVKVRNAQAAGATGVVVFNNKVEGTPITMSGVAADITIPSLFILLDDGLLLVEALDSGVVQLTLSQSEARDISGAMDVLVVAHEWGHLISNRLIGDANGLLNGQGDSLGEGWSDFHSLILAVKEEDVSVANNDQFQGTYAIGSYVSSQSSEGDPYYYGLRRVPYSTNFAKNALTFKHIENDVPLPDSHPRHEEDSENADAHAAGEVWATALWEVYASLLQESGRLTFTQARKRMIDYLVAAYKMTPIDPTFTEARDALLAVAMASDSKDYLLMQEAFARRGLGSHARSPDRYSVVNYGVEESFSIDTPWQIVSAVLDTTVLSCDQDTILDVGETARLTLTLKNNSPVLLPATNATLSSTNDLQFSADGSVTLAETQAGASITISSDITLNSATLGELVQIEMTPNERWAGEIQTVWNGYVNLDLKPSFVQDMVQNPLSDWTMAQGAVESETYWVRHLLEDGSYGYLGEDPNHPSDYWMESPTIQVAETGRFRFQFEHNFLFEQDEDGSWDGGVVEMRVGENGEWVDLGNSMHVGYNGTILDSNPVLADRAGFVGSSPGYPAFVSESVDLGESYQGQVVTIRFRIGSDDYVGADGWIVRNIRFANISNLPFTSMIENSLPCGSSSTTEPVEDHFSIDGVVRGLASGDTLRLTAYSPSLGAFHSVELTGHGGDHGYSIQDLPPASDYQIFVTADEYQSSYWGGEIGGIPANGVPIYKAVNVDLSQHDMAGINLKLAKLYSLTANLDGVELGDEWQIMARSESRSAMVWQAVVVGSETDIQVSLADLPEANDYLLSITNHEGNQVSGFYTGDNQGVGSYLQALRLDLNENREVTMKMVSGRQISGHVENGEGVEARVTAWSESRWRGAETQVEQNGEFSLHGLVSASDYRICVKAETLAGGCYGGNHTVPYRLAVPLDVTDADQQGIGLTLTVGFRISGMVSGLAQGDSAWVQAWSIESGHLATAEVNADGTYLLQGLPSASDYEVTMRAAGYQIPAPQRVEVGSSSASLLDDGSRATQVNFETQAGGSIEGSLDGLQRGDSVTVRVYSPGLGESQQVTLVAVDTQTLNYRVSGLAEASDYCMSLETPQGHFFRGAHGQLLRNGQQCDEMVVNANETLSDINFALGSEPSFTLSGSVTGLRSGDKNSLVTVRAWSQDGGMVSHKRVGEGSWLLSGLGSGSYYLLVEAAGYVSQYFAGYTDGTAQWHASSLEAKSISVLTNGEGLDVVLVPGHTISGLVTTVTDEPAIAVYVNIWDSFLQLGGGVLTRADGSFSVAGLLDGTYLLETYSEHGEYRTYLDYLVDHRDLGIFKLVKKTGAIVGQVTGNYSAHALIMVYTSAGKFVTSTTTDSNGLYQIDQLETGVSYRLQVDSNDEFSVMEGMSEVGIIYGSVTVNIDLSVVE